MIRNELLEKICCKDTFTKRFLSRPIVRYFHTDEPGGYVYACDGRMAVRVKFDFDVPEGVVAGDNDELINTTKALDRFIECGDGKRFDKKRAEKRIVRGREFEEFVACIAGCAKEAMKNKRMMVLKGRFDNLMIGNDIDDDINWEVENHAAVRIDRYVFNAKYIAQIFDLWTDANPVGRDREGLMCGYWIDKSDNPAIWFG